MNEYDLTLKATEEIKMIGGISIRTGMQLEALGYDVMRLEDSIKAIIKKGKA